MANPGAKVKSWKLDSTLPVQQFLRMYIVHLYSSAFEYCFLFLQIMKKVGHVVQHP